MGINFNTILIAAGFAVIYMEVRRMGNTTNQALQNLSDKEDALGVKIDGINAEFATVQSDFATLSADIAKIQPGVPVDPTLLQSVQDKADALSTKLDAVGISLASVDTSITVEDATVTGASAPTTGQVTGPTTVPGVAGAVDAQTAARLQGTTLPTRNKTGLTS